MIKLLRIAEGAHTTLGQLYINDLFQCYILEDKIREQKIPGETAIPAGNYPLVLNKTAGMNSKYSVRYASIHKGMVEIKGIPEFTLVFFHIGNYHTDTRGCLLTGSYYQLVNGDYRVLHSADAYKRVYPLLVQAAEEGRRLMVETLNC
ncbi:DUF5675 family protein [Olivibacter domesticus]|uniref:DUF5675 domain-containing protein n=1 Tax=Olivibacter domesticus TaxID=407022 RepID=A0A1H7JL96_OLID1|nr:DUF5675 family protein [Olivibacter domesticus]SEK75399.1 hypothetical protein SAMN05661044_01056 [Olivibacter domesticus]